MRILATITAQPHSRKKLTPKSLVPLPWDSQRKNTETVSRDEAYQRFLQLTQAQKSKKKKRNGR